ncbi:PqqD family protein [Neobacillus sp. NPDC093182]|uniref:PqqD family protein n=1 Tax=Neobacillus sp. NPDC093182 TaxID=3364297 RepID=UPI0037FDE703
MMTHFIQKGNVEATELDGEWIILNTEQYTITKLNGAGGLCWSLLNKIQTVDTLTNSLVKEYKAVQNKEQIKQDVEEFLSNLTECGLIEHVNRL